MKRLKLLYEVFRTFAVALGLLLWLRAAGMSDYHTLVLKQDDPECVGALLVWGLVLMIPWLLHKLREYLRDRRNAR